MEYNDIGVHADHCCIRHGCKYGDEDCPVELGIIEQSYDCELNNPIFEPCIGKSVVEIKLDALEMSLNEIGDILKDKSLFPESLIRAKDLFKDLKELGYPANN